MASFEPNSTNKDEAVVELATSFSFLDILFPSRFSISYTYPKGPALSQIASSAASSFGYFWIPSSLSIAANH
jgi:hypothetical protein